ncbi:hypothetical protein [Dokdonella soli]|uniref:DUF4013 domain-containing protein n=1 Tax=Dokdonella soli TaxID=529810 RepID=A0ABN1IT89_9GAMM
MTTDHPPIEPFWNRLREISLYPAHSGALTTIVVLALCRLVGYLPLGVVGWLFQMLIWVALYKYAFECLRASANGRLKPPEIAVSVEDSLGWSQIWLQVAFFALNLIGFLLLGPVGGAFVAIFLALALPGAIMSLAMDENLGHALNPATWLAIMGRFGWPYIAVAALYFMFNISQRYAQALVLPFLPPVISAIAFHFITGYAVVATFHLMGYLIYQYHEEVGYEPVQAPPPLRNVRDDPDQATLDEVARLVRDGQPDAASELVGAQLRGQGGSEALHAQYRKLLALGDRRDEQLRHGREWISMLLAQDKDRRAVDVARECLELDPGFQLAHPDQVSRVAQKAVDAGNTQVALKLVSGFHKRYPKHADIPQNYLLAAKLLAERMGKDAEARALLDQLTQAYPNHALAADIAAYRRFLDKLTPATSPAR